PLRPGSPLLEMNAPDDYVSEVFALEPCPVLDIRRTHAELRKQVPHSMLKKFEYYRRRLTKLGEWSLVVADERNFAELFQALIANHEDRRSSRGELGVFSNERTRKFHWEAAALLLARKVLRLYGLRFEGKIAASLYGFSLNQRIFFY